MTGLQGTHYFQANFYYPLYPGVYGALLLAWQEYRPRRGWEALIFHGCAAELPLGLSHITQPQVTPRPQQGLRGNPVGEG